MSERVTYGEGGYDPEAPDGNVAERSDLLVPAEVTNEALVVERLLNDLQTIRNDAAWAALTPALKVEALRRGFLRLARTVLHAYQDAD